MAEFKRIEVTDPAHADVLNEKIVEPAIELAQKVNKNAEDIAAVDQKVNAHLKETAQNHVHGLSPERVRAIYVSTDDPDDEIGEDGDIWIKYEE